jgi:hypothetical protein
MKNSVNCPLRLARLIESITGTLCATARSAVKGNTMIVFLNVFLDLNELNG